MYIYHGAACGARLEYGGVHKAQGHVSGVDRVRLGAYRARAGLAPHELHDGLDRYRVPEDLYAYVVESEQ